MKKCFLWTLLILILLSGCGTVSGGPTETGTGETAALPDNFFIDIDPELMNKTETACVITAKVTEFDRETAKSTFMRGEAELTGYLYIASDGVYWEYLAVNGGKMQYYRNFEKAKELWAIHIMTFQSSPYKIDYNERYLGEADFEGMSFEGTRQSIEGMFSAVGVPLDSLTRCRTFRISREEQREYVTDPTLYTSQPPTEEQLETLSNRYAIYYRQYIGGIPVNNINWLNGLLNEVAPQQFIFADLSEKGAMSVTLWNVLTVSEQGEERRVLTYEEALAKLIEAYSGIILTAPKTLMDAELCYAIYQTGDKMTVKLYPFWIFTVGSFDGYLPDGSEYRTYKIISFDAFTGERIVGNVWPG